jgi:hypothetical protein
MLSMRAMHHLGQQKNGVVNRFQIKYNSFGERLIMGRYYQHHLGQQKNGVVNRFQIKYNSFGERLIMARMDNIMEKYLALIVRCAQDSNMVHENGGYWHTACTNELETSTV